MAAQLNHETAAAVATLRSDGSRPPSLHVVLCGDDPSSATYVRNKRRVAADIGINAVLHSPSAMSTTAEITALVAALNTSPDVDAILVQLPLPAQVDEAQIVLSVDPRKDADGFHPLNFGMLAEGHPGIAQPCTPAGCMELLHRYAIPVAGRRAVVVGRSAIVGRPMALLLTNADATVTVCHSRTADLAGVCREAEILVAAAGRPGMIDARHVQPGAVVIDVGTTPVEGRLRGDVDFEAVREIAGFITPVPGGVGPMTIAMLMRNVVALAREHRTAT